MIVSEHYKQYEVVVCRQKNYQVFFYFKRNAQFPNLYLKTRVDKRFTETWKFDIERGKQYLFTAYTFGASVK